MFVPVTTKPYLSSITFIIFTQGVPAFFLSIKETTNKHFIACKKQDNSTNASNLQWPHGALQGIHFVRF
jgi:hypothetical protein